MQCLNNVSGLECSLGAARPLVCRPARLRQIKAGFRNQRGSLCLPSRASKQYRVHAAHPELADYQSLPTLARIEADDENTGGNPFRYPLQMEGQQKALSSIPGALFYPLALAAIGVTAAAAGLGVRQAPIWSREEEPIAQAVSSGVVALAGSFVALQAKKKRDGAAYVDLYNKLVSLEEPSQLTKSDLEAISSKYMVSWGSQQDGLKNVYGIFLESVVPQGDKSLRGDEAERIRSFKSTLGLTDEEAAEVHIEVGRRLNSRSFEAKDRAAAFEQRKSFQRLIYLSILVFGDQKAAFLLPWQRVFNLNPNQVFIAKRDNSKAVFRSNVQDHGADIVPDRKLLRTLREKQLELMCQDDSAEDVVREYVRKHIEKQLDSALEQLKTKTRTRDYGVLVEIVSEMLEYRRRMLSYANEEDLVPGLGHVTITGGTYDVDTKRRDLLDLYRVYMEESLVRAGNRYTEELEGELAELATMLALPAKDTQPIQHAVASALYKKLLREEVKSRRIDEAASPAMVLGELCERTRFSPEGAADLHAQLYSQKYNSILEKKAVTAEDEAELARIQRVLCIQAPVIFQMKKATAGKILREAMDEMFSLGAKPIGEYEADRIEQLVKDLKLDQDIAMEIFAEATRMKFMSYIIASKKVGKKKEASSMLKQMIQFNVFVATPVLERIKGYDAAQKELAKIMGEALAMSAKEGMPEIPKVEEPTTSMGEQVTRKFTEAVQKDKGEDVEKKGQKEVTVAKDVELKDRQQLYKDYLLATMSGDVVELPVGGMLRKKANSASSRAENWRLTELAGILGLSQMEIGMANQDLAEQAFRAQATEAMRSAGYLSKERQEELATMAGQLGIPKERADTVLRDVKAQVLGVNAATADGEGWTVAKLLELSATNIDVEKAASEQLRTNLFRKELEKKTSDGESNFDNNYMLEVLPQKLKLDKKVVDRMLKEVVGNKKRMLLVQAISQQRQKRQVDAVKSMSDLLSCYQAQPEPEAAKWNERNELLDLFTLYCTKVRDEVKQQGIQNIFGLTPEEIEEAKKKAAPEVSDAAAKAKEDEDAFF